MGFFDRVSDSKYSRIGKDIASFAFSMCNHDDINKLLKDCQFSSVETTRFRFDFFIVNLVIATHAINVAVYNDKEKAEKIIEPMYDLLEGYLERIVPDDIRIGDFIVKDDEWQYLRKNHQVDNPDMRTNCNTLLSLMYNYRNRRYFGAMTDGFGRFMAGQPGMMGPFSPLVRLFVQNFPSSEENTNHLIVTLCMILASTHNIIMEYCKKNIL